MFIEQLPSGKYRYQMLYVEERTGKKKRVSVALAKNTDKARREAEQILTEKIRQINASVSVGDIAFGDLSERFQKARAGSWRDSTAHRYHYSIKALCVALGADISAPKAPYLPLSNLFPAQINPSSTREYRPIIQPTA